MKLLFHCCCAPCALSCVGVLREEGKEPELFWYNPNIHPYTEYASRRDALAEFAAAENLKLESIDEYGLVPFIRVVFPVMENGRCTTCYRMRLEKAALFAAENNFGSFSTSLLISPYQDHGAIKAAGEEAAAKYGVDFLYRDFRSLFRDSRTKARSLGLYMQKYCGCIFSEEERYLKPPKKQGPDER